MKFSYNWLKELAGFTESPKELAELLTMHVFEVESIDKAGNDHCLDVAILPNRVSDASGHFGLAREIAAIKKKSFVPPKVKVTPDTAQRVDKHLHVDVKNPKHCPRYTARMMTKVKVGPSPKWLAARLELCGIQPINNLVDTANYVMLETGQPLHVFDYDALAGSAQKKIIVRSARTKERIETLDDVTYTLNTNALVIADDKEAIAVAGIKGGKSSGVSPRTTTIVLESANFNPALIYRTSKDLALRTDASYRFAHGMDPAQTHDAIDRLAALIQQLAGGAVLAGSIDAYPKPVPPRAVPFRVEYANRHIGHTIPELFYEKTFKRLGCSITKKSTKKWVVDVPSVRRDIALEEDLIEEAVRLFGLWNIPAHLPSVALSHPQENYERTWEERSRDFFVHAGFSEHLAYRFTSEAELGRFSIKPSSAIAIENPQNPETAYLLPRTLIAYLQTTVSNQRHADDVRIFGYGTSFKKQGHKTTKELIAVRSVKGADGRDMFYELKGLLDALFASIGISDHGYEDAPASKESVFFHPHRVARVTVGNQAIGMMGEMHPSLSAALKSKACTVAAELSFDLLVKHATAHADYTAIPKYPALTRDVSLLVPLETRVADILSCIQTSGGDLLADVDLFDFFEDATLAEQNQKSVAFHLLFQSHQRTLKDAEADAAMKKIVRALKDKNWVVR